MSFWEPNISHTLSMALNSSSESGLKSFIKLMLSSICSILLIPESTIITPSKEAAKRIAKLAGLPDTVIDRAKEIVNELSKLSKETEETNESVKFKDMIILAIATSIDALAVGVTLAFLKVNIVLAIIMIGIITFIISMIGVKIGNVFGDKYKQKAELAGGIILIVLGIKILLEHLIGI